MALYRKWFPTFATDGTQDPPIRSHKPHSVELRVEPLIVYYQEKWSIASFCFNQWSQRNIEWKSKPYNKQASSIKIFQTSESFSQVTSKNLNIFLPFHSFYKTKISQPSHLHRSFAHSIKDVEKSHWSIFLHYYLFRCLEFSWVWPGSCYLTTPCTHWE